MKDWKEELKNKQEGNYFGYEVSYKEDRFCVECNESIDSFETLEEVIEFIDEMK